VRPEELPTSIPTHLPEKVWPGGWVLRLYGIDGTVLREQVTDLGLEGRDVMLLFDVMREAGGVTLEAVTAAGGETVAVLYDGDTGDLLALAHKTP
jgi:hypothetical protein